MGMMRTLVVTLACALARTLAPVVLPAQSADTTAIPHGALSAHVIRDASFGRVRTVWVYTPPGYDATGAGRFPTLYLQHGSGDNQATWVAHGKAHWILDNLIAQGRVKPMVVVMMDGHAAIPGGMAGDNTALFERDLLEDVLPFVEMNYRVLPDGPNRALAGLSMGGGQALTTGLNRADLFGWVGGFSSATPSKEAVAGPLTDAAATNKRLKLLWIACGKDDFLLKRNEEFIALLKEKGVHHDWQLTDGNHSWPVWRLYLADFAPKLFR